jgi:carboxypeptidase family protein/TonB-dependent receptor-like protein
MRCLVGRKGFRLLLASATLLALGTVGVGPVDAQVLYGTLVGDVTDTTKAGVPGAAVTITHKETNLSREGTTDTSGSYRFINVQPGTYTVKISMPGFKEYSKENVPVTPNTISRVDVSLAVGQLTEAITVQSERALLQTDKADLHSELSAKEISSLPLSNYRNYQSLLNLVPGATPARFQNAVTDTPARALTTNVNGTNRMTNTTRLDGTTNVFIWLPHHSIYVAPSETVETVNVTTNSFDAEQGMAGGAAVTVLTKSGTNDFRGVLFAMNDNEKLRARNFFLPLTKPDGSPNPKPKTRRNIDGVTLGGPIVKNKLFFFVGWEGNHESAGRTRTGTVPTAAMRNGDFSGLGVTLYDPATGDQTTGAGRTPFPGNQIPLNRMDQAALKLQALIPLPSTGGTTNNFTRSDTQKLDRNNYDFKLNFNRSSSHQIWAKYSQMNALVTCNFFLEAAGGVGLCDGGSGKGKVDVKIASVGHTWTLSPRLVLDGVFGLTRHNQDIKSPDFGSNFGSDVLGIPGTNGPDPRQSGMPIFNFGDTYNTLGNADNWSPIFRDERTFTANSSLTYVRDKHEFKFGVDVVKMELNHWQPELGLGPRGGFRFLGGPTAIPGGAAPNQFNNYAAFLLGLPTSMNKSLQYEEMTGREWQLALYLRDRWQISRSVTLSAGVRFERYPLMTRKDRGIERYDPATNTVLLGGKGGNPTDLGIKETYPFIVPRLGIAWRVTDTSVLRAGYGMTISPIPFSRPLRGFYPLTINQDFIAPNSFVPFGSLRTGIPAIVGPNLETGAIDLPPTADMRSPYADTIHRGYIQSWNLSYERKLPGDIAGTISYVGTQTTHQLVDKDINAAEPGGGTAGQPLYPAFKRTGPTRMWDGWLSAHYHGLQVALNRPFTKGMFIKAAYTYSRAMNYSDDEGWATLTFNSPSAIPKNYSRAGYDQPHVFQLGFVADLPFGKNSKSVLGAIVKNWQINGIASAFSGRPFTPSGSGASLNAPAASNTQTPDQIAPIKVLGGKGPGQPFIDPSSFKPVTEVRFGNMGRNSLRGPSTRNLDLSLFRRFPVRNRVNLEARIEAYNVTNTPHFSGVNDFQPLTTTIASAAFLQLNRADSDERQIRLGLRLSF